MSFFLRELLSFTSIIQSSSLAGFASYNKLNALYAVFKVLLVGSSGLEPPTSRLSGVRSNQLSYEPIQSDPADPSALETSARELRFLAQLKSWWR